MPQKFFEDSIESKFIKALLRNTQVPIIPTVHIGDYIIKDCSYIHGSNVIKCTRSGYLTKNSKDTNSYCSTETICGKKTICGNGVRKALYDEVAHYRFGEFYPNITQTYVSNRRYYDRDTHYHLGQLLRCIRDLLHIDLMPFYNCFAGHSIDDINILLPDSSFKSEIGADDPEDYISAIPDNRFKTYAIPIKFDQDYTIAIDSSDMVKLKAAIYDSHGHVSIYSTAKSEKSDFMPRHLGYLDKYDLTIPRQKYYSGLIPNDRPTIHYNTDFKKPFKYRVTCGTDERLKRREQNLSLILQVPKNCNSSIVVLEGDYTSDGIAVFDRSMMSKMPHSKLNELLTGRLSLLKLNDMVTYAFSDRLIEYLLMCVITDQDDIHHNIARVQTHLMDPDFIQNYVNRSNNTKYLAYQEAGTLGVWDDNLRVAIYDLISNNGKMLFDTNGFVDKDVERYITKGHNV